MKPEKMLTAIRSRVTELGLTQTELGQRCGWPQSLVSRYLSGQKEPGMESLTKLARAVGCEWVLVADQAFVAFIGVVSHNRNNIK